LAAGVPGPCGRLLDARPDPPARRRRAGCRRLAGLWRARHGDALPVAGHRAPFRLGQREPVAVRSAVPAAAAGRMEDRGWKDARTTLPDRPGAGRGRGGRGLRTQMGAAAVAGQRAVDRPAAAAAPGAVVGLQPPQASFQSCAFSIIPPYWPIADEIRLTSFFCRSAIFLSFMLDTSCR